ncbi:MAG TPA: SLATT domain-containing protein [Terriglobales bacterium]
MAVNIVRGDLMDGQVPAPEIGKGRKRLLWTVAAILVVGAVIGLTVWVIHVPRGRDVDRITGYNQQSGLLPPSQRDLGIVLAENYHEYRTNSAWWSLAYYGCLFLSAFLSAMAAFVLKVECFPNKPEVKKDLAALFSTIAAVLITLSTVGNFQQKWQANRLAATAMQNLVYDVWAKGAECGNKADICSRIEEVNQLRNQEIVGGGKDNKPPAEPTPVKSQPNEPAKAK